MITALTVRPLILSKIAVAKVRLVDFPGRIHGQHSFFRKPGKHHSDGCHVLLDRWWRRMALQRFDIGRDRNGLDVYPARSG